MPGLTHGQHLAALAQAPKYGARARREYVPDPPDPPDLLEQTLAASEAMLKLDRVSFTQLEACVIGLRKWTLGRGIGRDVVDPRAVAMTERLQEAQETRAWRAKWGN